MTLALTRSNGRSGFPRWKSGRVAGQFKTTFDVALSNVRKSQELFAKDSGKRSRTRLLPSNIDFNVLTLNTGKRPSDPGVAVWSHGMLAGLHSGGPIRYAGRKPASDPPHH